MSLERGSVETLRHAADACVSDVPFYEPHPDTRVAFRELATARIVRQLCDDWLAHADAAPAHVDDPERLPRIGCWCPKCRAARGIK